jgi:hypothetical protein
VKVSLHVDHGVHLYGVVFPSTAHCSNRAGPFFFFLQASPVLLLCHRHPIPDSDANCAVINGKSRTRSKKSVLWSGVGSTGPHAFLLQSCSSLRLAQNAAQNRNPQFRKQLSETKQESAHETARTRHHPHRSSLSGSYWPPIRRPPLETRRDRTHKTRVEPTAASTRWWWEGPPAPAGGGRGRSLSLAAPCSATGAPRGPPSPRRSAPAPRTSSRPRYAPNPSSCLCHSHPL